MCYYKIIRFVLIFLYIFYRFDIVYCSVKLINSNINNNFDTYNNETTNINYSKYKNNLNTDKIPEFDNFDLLNRVLSNTRNVPVRLHNDGNNNYKNELINNESGFRFPKTKFFSEIKSSTPKLTTSTSVDQLSDKESKDTNLSDIYIPRFHLSKSKIKTFNNKSINSTDPIDLFLNSGIKVYTLNNECSNNDSKCTDIRENDTSQFEINNYSQVLECIFNDNINCIEIKYKDNIVWKFGDHGLNLYPKLLRFDLIMTPMIDLEFHNGSFISFVYRDNKWNVRLKKLNENDIEYSKNLNNSKTEDMISESLNKSQNSKLNLRNRLFEYDDTIDDEDTKVNEKNKESEELMDFDSNSSHSNDFKDSKYSSSETSNDNSSISVLPTDKSVFQPVDGKNKYERIEELDRLKELEELRLSQSVQDLVRPEENEQEEFVSKEYKPVPKSTKLSEDLVYKENKPEKKIHTVELDVKKKENTDKYTYTKDDSTSTDIFLPKPNYKFNKVKSSHIELWSTTDPSLYATKVEYYESSKIVSISLGNDTIKDCILADKSNPTDSQIKKTKSLNFNDIKPIEFDIDSRKASDKWDYIGDYHYSLYEPKDNFLFNKVYEKGGFLGSDKEIWKTTDPKQYAMRVYVDHDDKLVTVYLPDGITKKFQYGGSFGSKSWSEFKGSKHWSTLY